MELTIATGPLLRQPADLAVLATFEDTPLPTEVAALLEPDDFRGRAKQSLLLYPRGAVAPRRLLLLGLGRSDDASAETIRQAAAIAVQKAQELRVAQFTMGLAGGLALAPERAGQAFAEGAELGAYRYQRYKTGLTEEQTFTVQRVSVLIDSGDPAPIRAGVAVGQAVARGVALARDLANGPGNVITPAALGETALALGASHGLRVTVLDKAALQEQGFGGILAVGQGSANEPRFIVMEYGEVAEGRPTICLVGKGITFDTGGISIKPAEGMDNMKMDMGGAAAVFGAMQTVAELALPLHVVGLICAAENMPGGTAYRPGDIITTLSGKTVEVLNTDAEGRIVLADGLFYAQRYRPAAIVDLATLTGAIAIALGPHAIGMMGTSQELIDRLSRAGQISAERPWQLPLWDEYRDAMKSEIADLKNVGIRQGGAINAAGFLAAFVGDYPWVHLDIAGTAWVDRPTRPYQSRGATGVGVRLLTELLQGYLH
ncbi:MAG: leucyl aminopeptidase [Chloroflexi bacterium OHK40]